MKSLRLRLLLIIGAALLLLWSLVAAWMLADLRGQLRAALDDRLAASARMVAALVAQLPAASALPVGQPGPLADVIGRDGVACEVSLLRGEVSVQTLARTATSPGLQDLPLGYGTRTFGGKTWRTYVLQQGPIRVATADRIDVREGLLREVALAAGVPFAVALVGSLGMLWFAIGGGLAPLERIRKVLAQRRPDDDQPLPSMPVPREMRPLVGTIAHLLERVRNAIARERRFTDDAAHELRTPLTAIKTHLQVLRLASGTSHLPPAAGEALAHADDGVLRMQRTIEQLLLLARLDGAEELATDPACDPADAVREAIRNAEAGQGAAGRIALEQEGLPASVGAPCSLLASALRNLLENALRSSAGAASPVTLRVERLGNESIAFTVLDRGAGLSAAECELAVQRFWRRSKSGAGSGLGLAIVNSIAQRCGGELSLQPREGGGLCARLTLPQGSRHVVAV